MCISIFFFLTKNNIHFWIKPEYYNQQHKESLDSLCLRNEGEDEGIEDVCLFCFTKHLLQEAWVDTALGRIHCELKGEYSKMF